MIESGYPGFVSDTFNALFAPAGTPPEIVALLVKEARAAMQRPEAHRGRAQVRLPDRRRHARSNWRKRLVAEIQGVKELVARAGIKPEN